MSYTPMRSRPRTRDVSERAAGRPGGELTSGSAPGEAGQAVEHRGLRIDGLDCADCAINLERGLARINGVIDCQVSFAGATIDLSFDPSRTNLDVIGQRVHDLGYSLCSVSPAVPSSAGDVRWTPRLAGWLKQRPREVLTLTAGILITLAFMLQIAHVSVWAWQVPYVLAIVAGGFHIARRGWNGLRLTRRLDINFLMTIAAVGAAFIGEWAEAALVVTLFSFGEMLEARTMDRARGAIRSLMKLAPAEATVLRACRDCSEHLGRPLPGGGSYAGGECPWCARHEERLPVSSLRIGDLILVRPGERIAMDGTVRAGESAVNQAPITGESIPADKSPGGEVFAGTINGSGALEIVVSRLVTDNTLSRIIQMVEAAQARKAPSQRWIDQFAQYYTPAVVAFACLMAAVPPLVFGQPFLETAAGHGWFYRALALLITACPCALVISTPVTIVSAISRAARGGVLIKGGAYLEMAGRIKAVAFDKTGTLTRGEPAVTEVYSSPGRSRPEVLGLAAAVEARSEHPLARAIVHAARQAGVSFSAGEGFQALAGKGAQALVDGRPARAGGPALFESAGLPVPAELAGQAGRLESAGNTIVLVHGPGRNGDASGEFYGLIAITDTLRPESRSALIALKRSGISHTVMLTGDNQRTAAAMAASAGIDEVRAGLLPDQKVQAVEALQAEFGPVAMVGDGVNDAPALASAGLGVAMGVAGSDQALETADVVLMSDDLHRLPFLIQLSRRTLSVLRQNITFSLAVKALVVALVLPGWAVLWMAVLADVGTSLLVTLNGMRLLRE
jgi:Zn2+/Cd2+-exporting ATPase